MSTKLYEHQLDAKNRMRIPAKVREELGNNYSITVGSGGCLYVYTEEQMKEVKATLKNINAYREKQLKAARFILYNTWEAEEDKQEELKTSKSEKIMVFNKRRGIIVKSEGFINKLISMGHESPLEHVTFTFGI